MVAIIGETAPELKISDWVQGEPVKFSEEKGKVILVEVFQVNCPGCFTHGLPGTIDIYNKYKDRDLVVFGLATAFEDFDKNNVENLRKLLSSGEVIGETQKALSRYGVLKDGKLPYKIPFPIAVDSLVENKKPSQSEVEDFARRNVMGYEHLGKDEAIVVLQKVEDYLASSPYVAETFREYELRGTPSTILIDKKGIYRDNIFGFDGTIEQKVLALLNE